MQSDDLNQYVPWALALARVAADVCNFCDHVEHNEPSDRRWVSDAGAVLRSTACEISDQEGQDLRALYAARLRQVEQRNPTWEPSALDGGEGAERAISWRDLQLTQAAHDRRYHPDVVGLAKFEQLRHYALHMAKLAGATAEMAQGFVERDDFLRRRVPDLLLFGLKLPTVMGERLPETALTSATDGRIRAAA